MKRATERFSDKVRDYIKYRPGYPAEIFDYLQLHAKLGNGATIVDIGSGTGIFTKLLLDRGYRVYGVEPNTEMREAAEELLDHYEGFVSVNGSGEDTTLKSNIADLVVSATAFHWIDPGKAKIEFSRILKPKCKVALIWNIRKADVDEFSVEYEKFWQSYERSDKRDVTEPELNSFFEGKFETGSFEHKQEFDLEGLIGRSQSSSFSPKEGTTESDEFKERLGQLFKRWKNEHNKVNVHYTSKVYLGQVCS